MVLAGNESELDRMLKELIARQQGIDKRVERLETLEGMKRDDGRGCIFYEDYDSAFTPATSATVQFNPVLAPNGNYKGSHATIIWEAYSSEESGLTNLYMRFNALNTAHYNYAGKYSKGGALTNFNADTQNQFLIGRIPSSVASPPAIGKILVPYYPVTGKHGAFGDWSAYESGAVLNSREEKGEWGGAYQPIGGISLSSFVIFVLVGTLTVIRCWLYGWCPEIIVATGNPGD